MEPILRRVVGRRVSIIQGRVIPKFKLREGAAHRGELSISFPMPARTAPLADVQMGFSHDDADVKQLIQLAADSQDVRVDSVSEVSFTMEDTKLLNWEVTLKALGPRRRRKPGSGGGSKASRPILRDHA